ncbi:MAG TPA: transcription termination/antitermination protein NusG [Terriglobia bacterium]|nr:transcription termination/antitermination protein NusG [Terriglobia bacterium]
MEIEGKAVEAVASGVEKQRMAKNWYIIHSYSGFEKKVAETLRSRAEAAGLQDQFGQIMVPTEDVLEVRQGKKIVTPKLFYPGYVLVEMEMNDDTWHLVRSTPRVTGFVGSGLMPPPLTAEEVDRIVHRVEVAAEHPKPRLKFERGESVKINEGPFKDFTGVVDEINEDRSTLRVMVTIFGRGTPVELDFYQVDKG